MQDLPMIPMVPEALLGAEGTTIDDDDGEEDPEDGSPNVTTES